MTADQIKKEANRLFAMDKNAKKVFISKDGNSFFKEGDAINHKRTSEVDYVTVEKEGEDTTSKTPEEEKAKNIIINALKEGKSEEEIKKALEQDGISKNIINQLIHK